MREEYRGFKRCPIVFNLDNPSHYELYTWCLSKTNNFSDFARSLLFVYKESKEGEIGELLRNKEVAIPPVIEDEFHNHRDSMSEML